MNKGTSSISECKSLLVPRTLSGAATDYTFLEDRLVIIDRSGFDSTRRKVEIPWSMFERFVSELLEIEKMG